VTLSVLAVIGLLLVVRGVISPSISEREDQAWKAFVAEEPGDAAGLADAILELDERSPIALTIKGQIAESKGAPAGALGFYSKIKDDSDQRTRRGLLSAGRLELFTFGRSRRAEAFFRRVLKQDSENAEANELLGMLLAVEGRRHEAVPFLVETLRQGRVSTVCLEMLGLPYDKVFDPLLNEQLLQSTPGDPMPLIARARVALHSNETSFAREMLRNVVGKYPHQLEAHALLGQLALVDETAAHEAFGQWMKSLPPECFDFTQTWRLRGVDLQRQGDLLEAAACLGESIVRDPNNREALYLLGQILVSLKKEPQATVFLERAQQLVEYARAITNVSSGGLDAKLRAAQIAESLGRYHEALGWAVLAENDNTGHLADTDLLSRLRNKARVVGKRQVSAELIDALIFDSGSMNAEQSQVVSAEENPVNWLSQTTKYSRVRFRDLSKESGLQFTYFNSHDASVSAMRNLETLGGGVAVLDLDCDGWPDVCLTQGCAWPSENESTEYRDKLFRNSFGRQFLDVTLEAGFGDGWFSQGVTAGDFDSDGFPDVLVANIGANRLYRNNGDGTFTDVLDVLDSSGQYWTSSCMIADINGDADPDIYEVNYLDGRDALERLCKDETGAYRNCGVLMFSASQDQLHLNSGNGIFENITVDAGVTADGGKGLGIVAGHFDDSGALSVFVANDSTANNLFVLDPDRSSKHPHFNDVGLVRGIACDHQGRMQACMGIAAGDADVDGRIDLFVTNYSNDSNTLYLQKNGSLFADDTLRSGLKGPSIAMLGWGAQFIDGELDGLPDLVIANGNLDIDIKTQSSVGMPTQYFRNLGGAVFELADPKLLGEYFEKKVLGRSLARTDWNRDGLPDFIVSNIGTPVSLVTNETRDHGSFLSVILHGRTLNRDAIGATVALEIGERTIVQQVLAGDGFQSCNERKLLFGLGEMDRVTSLTVAWPGGLIQSWQGLPANSELILVEGRATWSTATK